MTEAEFWAMGQGALSEEDFWGMGAPEAELAGGAPTAIAEPPPYEPPPISLPKVEAPEAPEEATEPSALELAYAASEAAKAQGIDPYQANLQRHAELQLENEPRGAITGSLPYRTAESLVENLTAGAGQVAANLGEQLTSPQGWAGAAEMALKLMPGGMGTTPSFADKAPPADNTINEFFAQKRAEFKGQRAAQEAEQAVLDEQSIIPGAGILRQATTAVGESLAAGVVGGVPGLAAYYANLAQADALADGATPSQARAHALIEGAATALGGKLGAGTGVLASRVGGKTGETVAGKAADYLARKFPLGKYTKGAFEVAGAGLAESVEESLTNGAHYLTEVAYGQREYDRDEFLKTLWAPIPVAAAAGVIGGGLSRQFGGLADTVENRATAPDTPVQRTPEQVAQEPAPAPQTQPAGQQQGQRPPFDPAVADQWVAENPEAAQSLASRVAGGQKITRGDLEKLGVPHAEGSDRRQRQRFAERVRQLVGTEKKWATPEEFRESQRKMLDRALTVKDLLDAGVDPGSAERFGKRTAPVDEPSDTASTDAPVSQSADTSIVPTRKSFPRKEVITDEIQRQAQERGQEAPQEAARRQEMLTPPVSVEAGQQPPAPAARPVRSLPKKKPADSEPPPGASRFDFGENVADTGGFGPPDSGSFTLPKLNARERQKLKGDIKRLREKAVLSESQADVLSSIEPEIAKSMFDYAQQRAADENARIEELRQQYRDVFGSGKRMGATSARAAKVVGRGGDETAIGGYDFIADRLAEPKYAELAAETSKLGVGGDVNSGIPAMLAGGQKQFARVTADRFLPDVVEEYRRSRKPTGSLRSEQGEQPSSAEREASRANEKTWYHGGGAGITKDTASTTFSRIEGLFGSGFYLTDDPAIAETYFKNRGEKKPADVYQVRVNVRNVLEMESPADPRFIELLAKNFAQHELDGVVRAEAAKPGATNESVFSTLREELEIQSHQDMVPLSEYYESFQGLESDLRREGIDALGHTGGKRAGRGTKLHNVLILLDPRDEYGFAGEQLLPNPIADISPITEKFTLSREGAQETAPVVEPYRVPEESRLPQAPPRERQPQLEGLPEDLDENVLEWQQGLFGGQRAGGVAGFPIRTEPLLDQVLEQPNVFTSVSPEEALSATPVDPADVSSPVNAPKIVNALKNVVLAAGRDVPIRVGRAKQLGRTALGIFKVGPEVIRLQAANDIPTAAHETAHALEKAMFGYPKGGPWVKKLTGIDRIMKKELVALGRALYGTTQPKGGYKREGFAEYIRYWVTKPELAAEKAPAFHKWFTKTFLHDHPAIWDALQSAQELAIRWDKQGAKARAEASVIDQTSLGERAKRAKRWLENFFSVRNFIETSEALHDLARAAEKLSNETLAPSQDPYFIQSALRMTQHSRVNYWVNTAMTDLAGNTVGPSLAEAAAPVRHRRKDFMIYLWARRAKALLSDPKGKRDPGLSLADANQIISDLETPEFQLAASKFYDWQRGVLEYFAQASSSNAELVKTILGRDPGDYIPLQREFDEMATFWNQSATSGSWPLKRLRGSGRRIKDPFQAMVSNASMLTAAAHKRMVLDAVIKLSKIEGMGGFVEKIPAGTVPGASRTISEMVEEINRVLEASGQPKIDTDSIDDSALGHLVTMFVPARQIKAKPDEAIIPYYNNGTIDWYQVRPDLLRTISDQDVPRLGTIGELLLGLPASVFKAGTTGVRASFGLVTNPLRDIGTMYMNSRANGMGGRLLADYLLTLPRALGSRVPAKGDQLQGPWFDLFQRLGGEIALPLGQDFLSTRREVRRIFEGRRVATFDPRNWYDFYRDLVQTPESVPRVVEMKQVARQVGWEPGQPMTLDQSLELLLAAKQVTTDFTAGGEIAKAINRAVPFFNAAIQGPRAGLRAARRDPALYAVRGLIGITLPTILLWWLNKDEEWWTEMDEREKFGYWHIPINQPEETLLRIPRPFEVGTFFAALPEAMLDAWYRQEPEAVRNWFSESFSRMRPEVSPPLLQEGMEQLANKDFYFDTPIVPRGEEDLPAREQYNEYTSRTSVFLGRLFNVSPRRIDHGIVGVLGPVSMDLLDILGIGRKRPGREAESADTPIVGRLFQRGGRLGTHPKVVSELYEAYSDSLKLGRSKEQEESNKQRQRRLRLADAANAISALSYVRAHTEESQARQAITKEMVEIARKALMDSTPRGLIKLKKKQAELRESRVKN